MTTLKMMLSKIHLLFLLYTMFFCVFFCFGLLAMVLSIYGLIVKKILLIRTLSIACALLLGSAIFAKYVLQTRKKLIEIHPDEAR